MAQDDASPRMRVALGTILGIGGLSISIVCIRKLLLVGNPLQDEAMPLTLVGLCLLLFGAGISLPTSGDYRRIGTALK